MIVCAMCEKPMRDMTPEEEAEAREELQRDWGDVPIEDCEIICEECYQRIQIERLGGSLN